MLSKTKHHVNKMHTLSRTCKPTHVGMPITHTPVRPSWTATCAPFPRLPPPAHQHVHLQSPSASSDTQLQMCFMPRVGQDLPSSMITHAQSNVRMGTGARLRNECAIGCDILCSSMPSSMTTHAQSNVRMGTGARLRNECAIECDMLCSSCLQA